MKYDLIRPCKHCPFRSDIRGYLRQERAEEIAESLLRGQSFPCHETTVEVEDEEGYSAREATPDSQHCAGAMIMLEAMEMPNQMMRIAERIGFYRADRLDRSAPVFADAEEFILHHDGSMPHE